MYIFNVVFQIQLLQISITSFVCIKKENPENYCGEGEEGLAGPSGPPVAAALCCDGDISFNVVRRSFSDSCQSGHSSVSTGHCLLVTKWV